MRTPQMKKAIQVFITPDMQSIIQKWGNADKSANNYIFPHLIGN